MSYSIRRYDTSCRIKTWVSVGTYTTLMDAVRALTELQAFQPRVRLLLCVEPKGGL